MENELFCDSDDDVTRPKRRIDAEVGCTTSDNGEQRDNDHPLGHSKTLRDALINLSVERGIGCNPERYVPAVPKVFPEAELTGNSSTIIYLQA